MPLSKVAPRGKRAVQKPTIVTSSNRPGLKPAPVVEFPAPLFTDWIEPGTFHDALALHLQRHGDNYGAASFGPETH